MKSGFHDPIGIKKHEPKDTTPKTNQKVWNYEAPDYDERSSCFVNTGTHYGVGHKQPVGHTGNPKQHSPCLPFGRVHTEKTDEKG